LSSSRRGQTCRIATTTQAATRIGDVVPLAEVENTDRYEDGPPKAASTRDRIPHVALVLFTKKGFDRTSLREIAGVTTHQVLCRRGPAPGTTTRVSLAIPTDVPL
jgi:hypothetical protein